MMGNENEIPDFNVQLQEDVGLIDNYLAAKNIQNYTSHLSGLRYVIYRDSTGTYPTVDSCVTVNYQGLLLANELEFDKGSKVSFRINEVIEGWRIGMSLLNEGDSATLYIPSVYAYGYYGIKEAGIPSNANLIFHVGVTKVGQTFKSSTRSCD
jgi:FKBP-type peptidyl-prolyl cis-trans isomerase